jgi:hypothetical protein
MDFTLKYTGLSGRTFYTRYEEHMSTLRNNNGISGYSNHIVDTEHAYGSITDTMKIIKIEKTKKNMWIR